MVAKEEIHLYRYETADPIPCIVSVVAQYRSQLVRYVIACSVVQCDSVDACWKL